MDGPARLDAEAEVLAVFAEERNPTRMVLEVDVEEAFLHCAKALMRSRLWDPKARLERSVLPTMGEMLRDQTGGSERVETQEGIISRSRPDL
ncbi:MAG: hypothetical protein AAGI52_00825 [Bacteroidota bacterium]